jgi:hypothetical protein
MVGIISIGCLFPFLIVVGSSLSASGGEDADLIGVPSKLMSDARFWLALLCSTIAALLPDVVAAAMQRLCRPCDYQILQVRSQSNISIGVEMWSCSGCQSRMWCSVGSSYSNVWPSRRWEVLHDN